MAVIRWGAGRVRRTGFRKWVDIRHMQDFGAAFLTAFDLLIGADAALLEIIGLSLRVSITALLAAGLIGLSLGAALAVSVRATRYVGLFFRTGMTSRMMLSASGSVMSAPSLTFARS